MSELNVNDIVTGLGVICCILGLISLNLFNISHYLKKIADKKREIK